MRLKWKIKISAIVIIALTIIFLAQSSADDETTLKGWGNKFFDVLDQEVEDTKSFQKKQWEKMKKQFKWLFNRDDKEWNELDKEIKEKEGTTVKSEEKQSEALMDKTDKMQEPEEKESDKEDSDWEPKTIKVKKKKKKPVTGYYFDGKFLKTLYEDHWSTK